MSDDIEDFFKRSKSYMYEVLRQLDTRGMVAISEDYENDGTGYGPKRCWQYGLTERGKRALKMREFSSRRS